MSRYDEANRTGTVLPGPGRVGNPAELGRGLDEAVSEILNGLEGAADCRVAAERLAEERLSFRERTDRLAEILEAMARPAISELLAAYRRDLRMLRLDSAEARPILDERVDTLANYFGGLLRTHAAEFGEGVADESHLASTENWLYIAIWRSVDEDGDPNGAA